MRVERTPNTNAPSAAESRCSIACQKWSAARGLIRGAAFTFEVLDMALDYRSAEIQSIRFRTPNGLLPPARFLGSGLARRRNRLVCLNHILVLGSDDQ